MQQVEQRSISVGMESIVLHTTVAQAAGKLANTEATLRLRSMGKVKADHCAPQVDHRGRLNILDIRADLKMIAASA